MGSWKYEQPDAEKLRRESEQYEYSSMIITAHYNQYRIKELNDAAEEGWQIIHINAGGVALLRRPVRIKPDAVVEEASNDPPYKPTWLQRAEARMMTVKYRLEDE